MSVAFSSGVCSSAWIRRTSFVWMHFCLCFFGSMVLIRVSITIGSGNIDVDFQNTICLPCTCTKYFSISFVTRIGRIFLIIENTDLFWFLLPTKWCTSTRSHLMWNSFGFKVLFYARSLWIIFENKYKAFMRPRLWFQFDSLGPRVAHSTARVKHFFFLFFGNALLKYAQVLRYPQHGVDITYGTIRVWYYTDFTNSIASLRADFTRITVHLW